MKGGLNDIPRIHGIFLFRTKASFRSYPLKSCFEVAGQDDLLHLA